MIERCCAKRLKKFSRTEGEKGGKVRLRETSEMVWTKSGARPV